MTNECYAAVNERRWGTYISYPICRQDDYHSGIVLPTFYNQCCHQFVCLQIADNKIEKKMMNMIEKAKQKDKYIEGNCVIPKILFNFVQNIVEI